MTKAAIEHFAEAEFDGWIKSPNGTGVKLSPSDRYGAKAGFFEGYLRAAQNGLACVQGKSQEIERLTAERDKTAELLEAAMAREIALRTALQRIAKWHGEFPPTGRYWRDDKTEEMSYSAAYGSNGERDFMREIASAALGPQPAGSDADATIR